MRSRNSRFAIVLLIVTIMTAYSLAQEQSVRTKSNKRKAANSAKTRIAKKRPARSGASPARVLADRFDREAPQVGDLLPDISARDAEGLELPLRSLRGHYTVLTFGCLT